MGEGDLICAASFGDREAQASLVTLCLHGKAEIPLAERVVMAEPLARLAAEHGEPDDLLMLSGVLYLRASHLAATDQVRSARLFDEAGDLLDEVAMCGSSEVLPALAALLNSMCEEGDEGAAIRLNNLMDSLSPDEAAKVSQFSRQLVAQHG